MKILLIIFTFFLLCANAPYAREKGWVPIPQSADSSLSSYKKTGPAEKGKSSQKDVYLTVYDNQPAITEKELNHFIKLLPLFRSWTRENAEEAHPILSKSGKPDFQYSAKSSIWVKEHGFNVKRFFNIMGKTAAAMVILEEGNDYHGTRPVDMPSVSARELELVKTHFSELQNAGRNVESTLQETVKSVQ